MTDVTDGGDRGLTLPGVPTRPAGVRIIIAYKLAKAILQVAAALLLFYGATHGLAAALAEFAENLREHAVHAWSNVVAAALLRFTKGRHSLWLAAYALLGDALLSAFEAWALWRGFAWGSWLIVGATACLLPFEIHALARHIRVGRVVLFLVNLAIVAYLLRRVAGEHLHRHGAHSDPNRRP
jgi:uncharacterized membrane protein (DUF2068 family)